jgi:superfamily II DNA/RNA helicase
MTFEELNLDPKVLEAVKEAGYTTPTPIQVQAIPHALAARDVLGIAQTGTGKTASFTLPMITILNKGRARARMPRSLILCPTRELAAQVAENFDTYGKYCKLTKALLIGGVSFGDQDKLIDRGVDVLIATPGRLLDHFERGKLMLSGIEIMVVDEADRMLDMGFIPDIERIFKLTPFTRQTLFFSATMPPEITRLTEEFLSNPVRVEVERASSTTETITQLLCRLKPSKKENADSEKRDLLRALLRAEGDGLKNAIVFCNRKRDIGVVYKSLEKHGFNVGALHGDLDQSVRTATLDGFREGAVQILIASDVAARGLDIPSVSHVVNFDVPIHSEDYVHRIGRTGRAGRSGRALTIALPHEEKHVEKIEALIGKAIPPMELPAGARIGHPMGDEEEAPRRRDERAPARRRANDAESPRPAREPRPEGARPPREPRAEAARPPREALPDREPRIERMREATPAERAPRRDHDRGPRRDRGDKGEAVVGFGENPPAFLMRPVIAPKPARRGKTADEGDAPVEAA